MRSIFISMMYVKDSAPIWTPNSNSFIGPILPLPPNPLQKYLPTKSLVISATIRPSMAPFTASPITTKESTQTSLEMWKTSINTACLPKALIPFRELSYTMANPVTGIRKASILKYPLSPWSCRRSAIKSAPKKTAAKIKMPLTA